MWLLQSISWVNASPSLLLYFSALSPNVEALSQPKIDFWLLDLWKPGQSCGLNLFRPPPEMYQRIFIVFTIHWALFQRVLFFDIVLHLWANCPMAYADFTKYITVSISICPSLFSRHARNWTQIRFFRMFLKYFHHLNCNNPFACH